MLDDKGAASDVVWLAVPVFERGVFAGDYMVALSINAAITSLVPNWFKTNHSIRMLIPSGTPLNNPPASHTFGHSSICPALKWHWMCAR